MNLIRAARILIQEDDDPKGFITPYAEIDFYPNHHAGTSLDYIQVNIRWLNMLYRVATVENITGKFSIDGASPADEFSHRTPLQLNPHGWTNTEVPIKIDVKRYNLETITKMRETKRANGSTSIELSFELDGQLVQKTINQKYLYVE